MKHFLFLFILFFLNYRFVDAQVINNLVVFSNEGEPFTLILDGLKENQTPQTNVRVVGLDLKVYQVKVIFQNHKLKDVNTTLTFFRTGKECVFGLNKKGSKKHTMDYVSEKEIDGFLTSNPPPVTNNSLAPVETQALTPEPITQANNVNTTNASSFQTTLANITSQPTDAEKLTTALAVLQTHTFSVNEIKQVMALFSSEQSRLAFAKQVCTKTKDPAVYTAIMDAFLNQTVKQELQNFWEAKK